MSNQLVEQQLTISNLRNDLRDIIQMCEIAKDCMDGSPEVRRGALNMIKARANIALAK